LIEGIEADLDLNSEPHSHYSTCPAFRPVPSEGDIKDAVDLLLKSKKPVIVAGGGAVKKVFVVAIIA